MKYALKKPIELFNKEGISVQTITELNFREEVCSGDVRGLKSSAFADPMIEDILKVGGRLCAQPDVVMNRLSMADLDEVGVIVWGFLGAGRETGNAG